MPVARVRAARLLHELASTARSSRWPEAPPGAGRPVLLVPGLMAGDRSLSRMASWLQTGSWVPLQARTGLTIDCSQQLADRLENRLERAVERVGSRATVVGQSRGGLLGRALAVKRPDLVETVLMLGSPVRNVLALNPLLLGGVLVLGCIGTAGVPGVMTYRCAVGDCCARFRAALATQLPATVRAVAIHSAIDGLVSPDACLDPDAEQREVSATHPGMAVSAAVWREIALALGAPQSERHRVSIDRQSPPGERQEAAAPLWRLDCVA